ncbi:hypothetical protein ACFX11_014938 [Malus domestica]
MLSNLHCPPHPPLQERRLPHYLSSAGSGVRKSASKLSSPSARTPTVTSGLKIGSLPSSLDRSSSLSGRRKTTTHGSWDSRFIVLQQVEIKTSDDLLSQLRVLGEGRRSGILFSYELKAELSCNGGLMKYRQSFNFAAPTKHQRHQLCLLDTIPLSASPQSHSPPG